MNFVLRGAFPLPVHNNTNECRLIHGGYMSKVLSFIVNFFFRARQDACCELDFDLGSGVYMARNFGRRRV